LQNPTAILSLELGAAFLYWLVFVVIETAALQLVNWGNFRACIKGSLIANLASALLIALSLIWMPRYGLLGLFVGLILAIGIEGFILNRLNPSVKSLNWLAAALANLASFFILILPLLYFSR